MNTTELKHKFEILTSIRTNSIILQDFLKNLISSLMSKYKEISNSHNHIDYIFGVDAFYFQNHLLQLETDHIQSIIREIDNQMYCEFLELYYLIKKYVNELKNDYLINNYNFSKHYMPYKKINNNIYYDFNITTDLHNTIIKCINELEFVLFERENESLEFQKKMENGINLENIINTESFINTVLKARINVFIKYLNIFVNYHTKYYTRLLLKVKLQLGITNKDIKINFIHHINNKKLSLPEEKNYRDDDSDNIINMSDLSNNINDICLNYIGLTIDILNQPNNKQDTICNNTINYGDISYEIHNLINCIIDNITDNTNKSSD